jgi:hypothetical protein
MPTIENSLFLDMTSYGMTPYTAHTTVESAYHLTGTPRPATETVNVALVLPRANDPTALLESNWATRQTTLASLEDSGTLWTQYGASQAAWTAAVDQLHRMGLTTIGDATGSDGYVSSAESRTVWVSLSPSDFATLFGTPAWQHGSLIDNGLYYWNGNLSLPTGLDVAGIWFDFFNRGPGPAIANMSPGTAIDVQQGPQSIGNGLAPGLPHAFPGEIAQSFYNFPLADGAIRTATIGMIEPGSGDVLPSGPSFQQLLDVYRGNAGQPTQGSYYAVQNNGTNYAVSDTVERSLDVGVVASAAPGSTIGLYAGSGFGPGQGGTTPGAYSNVFTAFQAAFWDREHSPAVVSASYSMTPQTRPGSVFARAAEELFVDAALRNITVLKADNDFGSSWGFANGLANQNMNASSKYAVIVGGTSITTLAAAALDETVAPLLGAATANHLDTLWKLVAGGLTTLPTSAAGNAAELTFVEAVWNAYTVSGLSWSGGTLGAGDGGVDTTQPTPRYQTDYGLRPTSANPSGGTSSGTGRGAPDVAANAGGNMFYTVPREDMRGTQFDDGTSAAAPLWASLVAQIDTIFEDQGLPNLGYMNDLLYIAAAIAPASFNDIRYGNNVASYFLDPNSHLLDSSGRGVTLTGYGYEAGIDYDLASGLGTPNGTLLARALSAIAHSQMSFAGEPSLLDRDGTGWESGADQAVLVQSMGEHRGTVGLAGGAGTLVFDAVGAERFAWSSRLAQQSLQDDFDPRLVRLFDKQHQGGLDQAALAAGDGVAVSFGAAAAQAHRVALTSAFGFADYASADGAVRLARAVAVAETAGGGNDQTAIVRLRQNGEDNLALTFYRVDDLAGRIGGLAPGDAGYAAAAQARAYRTTDGGTAIDGPGYGNFAQTGLVDVDAGDLIAMQLTNLTSGTVYWAFSQANEKVDGRPVGHLWNYGLNTWGWEDTAGGGDRDYNDLVVGLDFTSAYGRGWLA